MFNEKLFERTKKLCGFHFAGEMEESVIRKYEKMLEVEFPNSYVEFIKRFGEGGICGTYINGISSENYSSVWVETDENRRNGIIPKEHIVVASGGMRGIDELICLDTSRMLDGECPGRIMCKQRLTIRHGIWMLLDGSRRSFSESNCRVLIARKGD